MKRISYSKYAVPLLIVLTAVSFVSPGFSQSAATKQELQQKIAALKQSVARNQQALRQYQWTETTETIFKGETKSTKQWLCQYGPDGKIQKTPIGPPQPPPEKKRGLRGRVIEKKQDEMKAYMQRVASLVKRYVPPNRTQIEQSVQSGGVSLEPRGGGIVTLVFRNYVKQGDSVSLTFDTAAKKIQSYDVNTYLDSPEDVVTLKVMFSSLPDGTNYVAQTNLDATAKKIQIRTTNTGYSKL